MATYTTVPRFCLQVLATVKVTFYRQVLLFFLVINFLICMRSSQNVCLLEMKSFQVLAVLRSAFLLIMLSHLTFICSGCEGVGQGVRCFVWLPGHSQVEGC